ncbi:hypothetical protein CSHISOI_09795 [Colletotrichum shisoi]|uniref:Secreted protein n=1 Tax=Colletotrichum shisoi TaxID=2078593 RepID=A0A5Q4BFX9_9PEZI|nr:hypothetical protein CSHISOI_09795 [Colletotrichum shisoi]
MLPTFGVSFLMVLKLANTQPTAATVKMKDSAEKTMPAKEAIRLGLTKATAVTVMASPAVVAATAGRTKLKVKLRSSFTWTKGKFRRWTRRGRTDHSLAWSSGHILPGEFSCSCGSARRLLTPGLPVRWSGAVTSDNVGHPLMDTPHIWAPQKCLNTMTSLLIPPTSNYYNNYNTYPNNFIF